MSTITAISGKKYDLAVFAAILAIITLQLIKLGNYPGLYFDGINPDYIALQLLNPQDLQTGWLFSRPWLGQPYHGTNGIIITLLSVLVTGSTSVLQFHITYGIVASLAVFLSYKILTHKAVGVSKLWATISSIILSTWPSLFTIIISQSYMCLFGSVCILGGILLFFSWLGDAKERGKLSLCYFLFGLSFYSYFNFLFFLPPLLIFTFIALRWHDSVSLDDVVTPLIAYTIGCGLYIVGWSQQAISMNGVDMSIPGNKVKLFLAVYSLLAVVFFCFFKRIKGRKLLLWYLIFGAVVWFIKFLPAFREMAARQAIVQSTSVTEKISHVINDYSSILTGRIVGFGGHLLFDEPVTVLNSHVLLCFVVAVIAVSAAEFLRRNCNIKWKIPVAVIAIYLCCSIVLGTRMQQHHYVPLLFITYLGFILSLQRIYYCISESGRVVRRQIAGLKNVILTMVVVSLIFFNLFNVQKIINQVHDTGGDNFWASEMTELANEAVHRKNNGIHEVYVFSEWGFFTSFDYLTMNSIPFVASFDKPLLTSYYRDGYDIVSCYWNKPGWWNPEGKGTSYYANELKDIGGGNGSLAYKKWTDKNGNEEFSEIRLLHSKKEPVASQKQ